MPFSILPIEFHAIESELRHKKIALKNSETKKNKCSFLLNGECTIYENRPVICRTHGLPLLYMNDDDNWELYVCDLNFSDYDLKEFTDENTYPQDLYNSKLYMLNKRFIEYFTSRKYGKKQLVPIKHLYMGITS